MTKRNIKVRVPATGAARTRVLDELKRTGFALRHDMPELGVATGEIDDSALEAARGIDGVEGCEDDPDVGLPRGET